MHNKYNNFYYNNNYLTFKVIKAMDEKIFNLDRATPKDISTKKIVE